MTRDFITLIETEAAMRGIAPATLCRMAVQNNRLYGNLCAGCNCTLEIVERLRAYIAANPPPTPANDTPSTDEDAA